MPPLLIAAVVVGGGLLLLLRGSSSSSGGPRPLTRADIPKLRELWLVKMYIGRELNACMGRQREGSLFNTQEFISFGVGLFTGVATLDPDAAIKAARATDAALTAVGGKKAPACQKEIDLTLQQLALHDQVCAELGLPKDITREQLQAIVVQLGGFNPLTAAEAEDPNDKNSPLNNWDRCVRTAGLGTCLQTWKEEGNPVPKYDPKTGLAVRSGSAPAAAPVLFARRV